MNATITSAGLIAIANASAGGFKIDITTFKIGSKNYGATEDCSTSATALSTVVLHTGDVSSIEVLSESSVRYECTIPPTTYPIHVGEIGLFLRSGQLFALGKVYPPLDKDADTSFTIYLSIGASSLGGVINVSSSPSVNLNRTPIDTLPDPKSTTAFNSVIVTDARMAFEYPFDTASLAVKYGAGDEAWSFIGYTCVARVHPAAVYGNSSFEISPNIEGFWLNDNERVLVQIVSGIGAGETRACRYTKILAGIEHTFEAITPFSIINIGSTIQIWRDTANMLPDRRGVPSTHVLYTGENSLSRLWDTSSATPSSLRLHFIQWSGVARQTTFTIPASAPKSYLDKTNLLLFIDGILQPFNNFTIYNNTLLTTALASAARLSLYVFYREPSNGSAFKLYSEVIETSAVIAYSGTVAAYVGKPSYDMPIVVEPNNSLGFYCDSSKFGAEVWKFWDFDGAKLVYTTTATSDMIMLVWGDEEITNGYSVIRQYEWVYDSSYLDSATSEYVFPLPTIPADNSYMLWVKGKLLAPNTTAYSVNSGVRIPMATGLIAGDYVKFVWIVNLVTTNNYAIGTPIAYTPNAIIPHIHHVVCTPATTFTLAESPINDNYIMPFVDCLKLDKDVDWRLQGSDSILFSSNTIEDGSVVDILYFTEDRTSTGKLLNNVIYNFKTTSAFTYLVPHNLESLDHILIFVEGSYCHKSFYNIAGSFPKTSFTIAFTKPLYPENCEVEVVIFTNEVLSNSRTDIQSTRPKPYIGLRRFEVQTTALLQQNNLLFIGSVYQHHNTYQVADREIVLNQSVPYAAIDTSFYKDLAIEVFTFVSGRNLASLDADLKGLASAGGVATNTGPYWGDPAGTNRLPNRMTISISTYTSGVSVRYIFTPPYASDNIMVFVHGALQYKDRDFVFISLGQIVFTSKIPTGYPVDIITFQATDDLIGYALTMKVFQQKYSASAPFKILCADVDDNEVLVFVEGIYFHKYWYTVSNIADGFTIQFVGGLRDGLNVEVNVWKTVQQAGSFTELNVHIPNPAIGSKNIVLYDEIVQNNSLVFAGPIYQNKSTYRVEKFTLQLDTPISYEHVDPINFKDLPVTVYSFKTGVGSTRLITRDELRENYLTRYGGDLKGPLYTLGDPESDLEVANKRYVDHLSDQMEQMRQLLANLTGAEDVPTYAPILSIAPNIIRVGDTTTLKIVYGSPGKSVELEVRGTSGIYNKRSIKGMTKLDGSFTLGPVGMDDGYSDYITVTAWVDGFRVANTIDLKVVDADSTIVGPAMIATDQDIYSIYDYITYSIADGAVGGRVTWSVNGVGQTNIPAGQPQFIGSDGTWSMQVPAGGIPTNFIVELFVDGTSCGTLNVIVTATSSSSLPTVEWSANTIYREEVLEISISKAPPYSPVSFSAKAVGMSRSGAQDTAGLINSEGTLNFGYRFTSPGDFVIYLKVAKHLFTKAIKVQKVSPSDLELIEQPEGYRAYIKQF